MLSFFRYVSYRGEVLVQIHTFRIVHRPEEDVVATYPASNPQSAALQRSNARDFALLLSRRQFSVISHPSSRPATGLKSSRSPGPLLTPSTWRTCSSARAALIRQRRR